MVLFGLLMTMICAVGAILAAVAGLWVNVVLLLIIAVVNAAMAKINYDIRSRR